MIGPKFQRKDLIPMHILDNKFIFSFFMKMIFRLKWDGRLGLEKLRMHFSANKKGILFHTILVIYYCCNFQTKIALLFIFLIAQCVMQINGFFFQNLKSDLTFNFFKPNLIVRWMQYHISWALSFVYQLVKFYFTTPTVPYNKLEIFQGGGRKIGFFYT